MTDPIPNSDGDRATLARIAHRRLYPSLTNPSYLVLRARRHIFSEWMRTLDDGRELTVLDVGGRYQPYRPLLGTRVSRYFAVDLIRTELVSVMASGEALPFSAGSFDLVIATQVLEYCRHPTLAVSEIHRVLRPGGRLLASVASFAPRFVDEECWRFTRTGLTSLLEPFHDVRIVPELSSVGSVCRTVNLVFDTFVRFDLARKIYRRTGCPLLNLLGLCLEKLNLTSNDQFASNYSMCATK